MHEITSESSRKIVIPYAPCMEHLPFNLPNFSPTSSLNHTQWYFPIMLRWLQLDDHPDSHDVTIHGLATYLRGAHPTYEWPSRMLKQTKTKQHENWKVLSCFVMKNHFLYIKVWSFSCLKYTQQLYKLYFRKKQARPLQQPGVNNFPSWVNNFRCWVDYFHCWVKIFRCWVNNFHSWVNNFHSWVNNFHSWVNNFRCSVNSFHSWVNNFHFWVNYSYSWVNNFHLSTKYLISRKQTNISQ